MMEEGSKGEKRARKLRFSIANGQSLPFEPPDNNDSIKVYARIKPPLTDNDDFLRYEENVVCYDELDKRGRQGTKNFTFHKVFNPGTTQTQIFMETIDKDVDMFVKGNDRLLFSYGTTGSGKTYTILGKSTDPGILPRCTIKLFWSIHSNVDVIYLCPDQGCDLRELSEQQWTEHVNYKNTILALIENVQSDETLDFDGSDIDFEINSNDYAEIVENASDIKGTELEFSNDKYAVWVSYLEVYNENIFDLLDLNIERKPLKIGMDSKKNNFVKGLTHVVVSNWMELWKVFLYGRARVHMNQTNLNKKSSRSHSAFIIKLIKTSKDRKPVVTSLTICDLAGTERQKKALNSGDKLKESRHINTSLMILNKCFSVVRENKKSKGKKIPPYRESKLTQIFQKAFSYSEQITMFVNLSLSRFLAEESKNVLVMSAVAQEMVKSIPTKRFLKPHSRFSVMCQMFNGAPCMSGVSGIFTITNSSIASNNTSDETIKLYKDQIKGLEADLKASKDEIKSLMETLEDARSEYLNLEKKCSELEENLVEEEALNEELEKDVEDLQIMVDTKQATLESLEAQLEKDKETISTMQERENHLLRENDNLKVQTIQFLKEKNRLLEKNEEIMAERDTLLEEKDEIMKERHTLLQEIQIMKENKNTRAEFFSSTLKLDKDDMVKKEKPKRKALLKALDHLDRFSMLAVEDDDDTTMDMKQITSTMNSTRTPRSTRKQKPNYAE